MGQASRGCGVLGLCWSLPSSQWQEALGSQGSQDRGVPPSLGRTGAFLLEVHPEVRLEDKSHPEPPSFPLGSALSCSPLALGLPAAATEATSTQLISASPLLAPSPRCGCHGLRTISFPDLEAQAGRGCGGGAWRGWGCVCECTARNILALAGAWGTLCSP